MYAIRIACCFAYHCHPQELAAKAWAQVDPSRELLEIPTSHYFALRLESVCSEQKLHYWLGGDLSVTEVENRYMHCPGIQVSAWRLVLLCYSTHDICDACVFAQ